jgi:hypothetical protein
MSVQKVGNAEEDLRRAREASDSLRKLLLAAYTGGIAVMLTMAGSLAGEGVRPRWVVCPVAAFTLGIVLSALGFYMQEKRSLRRKKAADSGKETVDIPRWMEGRTWTWICIVALILAIAASMVAIHRVDIPVESKSESLWDGSNGTDVLALADN